MAAFPRLLGVAVLTGIGIGLGLIFFVVPGVVLMVLWAVVGPVAVMERSRPFNDIFGRSTDLTSGSRWPIFGLIAIYLIAAGAIMVFVGAVFGVAAGAGPSAAAHVVDIILLPLLATAMSVISATGVAAIYVELRILKEGTSSDRESIAAVFD